MTDTIRIVLQEILFQNALLEHINLFIDLIMAILIRALLAQQVHIIQGLVIRSVRHVQKDTIALEEQT